MAKNIPENDVSTDAGEKASPEKPALKGAALLLSKAPKVLGPKSVLEVLSVDTKKKASLDIIRAIAELEGENTPATLAAVLKKARGIHLAPRSKEFVADPEKFLRGYVTDGLKAEVGLFRIA